MGHEIIVCGGRSSVVHDADLWLLRHFVLREFETQAHESVRDEPVGGELQQYFEAWSWVGPGVYLNLDPPLRDDPAWTHEMRRLLAAVRKRVSNYGEYLPNDYARTHVIGGLCEWFPRIPTASLLRAIDALEQVAIGKPSRESP